ncbi:hypothetical protein HYPDE_26923 [Hyphomicrobium denitrificans 1NES1]|uniref:Uncharacterized protein n=1 Tax=Hyphomicrobium denitrificans 1NES1 TaxID=670307 RepID=N0BAD2_9HYPH|nr:hypothetical protein HYPDE_26923 [Hyphomicrobium denitrificans 1NES1]
MRLAKVGWLSRADNFDRPRLLPATAYLLHCRRRPRGHEAGNPTRTRLTRASLVLQNERTPRGCLDGASRMSATIENAVSRHSCVGFGDQWQDDDRRTRPASADARANYQVS